LGSLGSRVADDHEPYWGDSKKGIENLLGEFKTIKTFLKTWGVWEGGGGDNLR